MWNWLKSSLCDDAFHITLCNNEALADEIHWPTSEEKVTLGNSLRVLGCIGFIDKTLIKVT
jgi:hypothetical protein